MSTQMIDTNQADESFSTPAKPGAWTYLKWPVITLGLFLMMTFIKLPTVEIKTYMQTTIEGQLAKNGVYLTAQETSLSFLTGPKYRMYNVELKHDGISKPVILDRVSIEPALIASLIGGQVVVRVVVNKGKSGIDIDFSQNKKRIMDIQANMTEVDLKDFEILSAFTPIQGSGKIQGSIHLLGNLNRLTSLNGKIDVRLVKVLLPEQVLYGMKLPEIKISDGAILGTIKKGELDLQEARLGDIKKPGSDLNLLAQGKVKLNNDVKRSNLDLTLSLKLSEKAARSLSMIEAFIGAGKQTDGSYKLMFQGEAYSAAPKPVPAS